MRGLGPGALPPLFSGTGHSSDTFPLDQACFAIRSLPRAAAVTSRSLLDTALFCVNDRSKRLLCLMTPEARSHLLRVLQMLVLFSPRVVLGFC